MISGFCFVAPALPSTSSSSRTNRDRNSSAKVTARKTASFGGPALGSSFSALYMRALLQNENAGVNYIRKSLQKRRDEVALGKLQGYADAGQVQQVSHCLCTATCTLRPTEQVLQTHWQNIKPSLRH